MFFRIPNRIEIYNSSQIAHRIFEFQSLFTEQKLTFLKQIAMNEKMKVMNLQGFGFRAKESFYCPSGSTTPR